LVVRNRGAASLEAPPPKSGYGAYGHRCHGFSLRLRDSVGQALKAIFATKDMKDNLNGN
jgi:hypothetical protein